MITIKQFSRDYAEKYGLTYKASETLIESVFEYMGSVLFEQGEDIVIRRFGTFKHKKMSPKRVRHPGTGEMMTMPERNVLQFKRSEIWDGIETAVDTDLDDDDEELILEDTEE